MNDIALRQPVADHTTGTQSIVIDEVFPHRPETIWRTLTDGALMARWIMPPSGFAAVPGTRFTFSTTPGGAWDGIIHCEVLDVVPQQRLSYSWRSGHIENVGYGAPLDSRVTFSLTKVEIGTRLRVEHSGFVLPQNEIAFTKMRGGWKIVVERLGAAVSDGS